jgi:hypothetical protein
LGWFIGKESGFEALYPLCYPYYLLRDSKYQKFIYINERGNSTKALDETDDPDDLAYQDSLRGLPGYDRPKNFITEHQRDPNIRTVTAKRQSIYSFLGFNMLFWCKATTRHSPVGMCWFIILAVPLISVI